MTYAAQPPQTAVVCSDVSVFRGRHFAVPQFEGFDAAQKLNKLVQDSFCDLFGEINGAYNVEGGYPCTTLGNCTFDYYIYGNLISLRLNIEKAIDKYREMYVRCFNIDMNSGDEIGFIQLFSSSSDFRTVTDNAIFGCISENPQRYKYNAIALVRSKLYDYSYYLDGEKLCICFDAGEIAPYSEGVCRFEFDIAQLLHGISKKSAPYFENIPHSSYIKFCGAPLQTNAAPIVNERGISLVPLRTVAEALGYEVFWDAECGACVNGTYLCVGVNDYGGISLSCEPRLFDGCIYVPEDFFSVILGELVVCTDCVDIYRETGDAYFAHATADYTFSHSASDCAEAFAKAQMSGNKAMQYALCDATARNSYYDMLSQNNWQAEAFAAHYSVERKSDISYRITYTCIDGRSFYTDINIVSYTTHYKVRCIGNMTEI